MTNIATQLRALDQASHGEAEKRIVAGAKVIFGYYLAVHEIRQYKQDYVEEERKDLRTVTSLSLRISESNSSQS